MVRVRVRVTFRVRARVRVSANKVCHRTQERKVRVRIKYSGVSGRC